MDKVILPKKGRLSKNEKEVEWAKEFKKARRQHSAVESAINALEVHGLDRCYDNGINSLKRYVAIAVMARNIQKIGTILMVRKKRYEKRIQKAA